MTVSLHMLRRQVTAMALKERVPEQLAGLLTASHPELRAAAVFTLGALVQVHCFPHMRLLPPTSSITCVCNMHVT